MFDICSHCAADFLPKHLCSEQGCIVHEVQSPHISVEHVSDSKSNERGIYSTVRILALIVLNFVVCQLNHRHHPHHLNQPENSAVSKDSWTARQQSQDQPLHTLE